MVGIKSPRYRSLLHTRRDGRVGRRRSPAKRVYWETGIEGSNPSLSAILLIYSLGLLIFLFFRGKSERNDKGFDCSPVAAGLVCGLQQKRRNQVWRKSSDVRTHDQEGSCRSRPRQRQG